VRPVTVYRLVRRGSIEKRIVELRHHKRALAAEPFGGQDLRAEVSVEEPVRLVREARAFLRSLYPGRMANRAARRTRLLRAMIVFVPAE
jgi:hypothetical protein